MLFTGLANSYWYYSTMLKQQKWSTLLYYSKNSLFDWIWKTSNFQIPCAAFLHNKRIITKKSKSSDIAAQLENVKRSISEEKIKLEKLFKLKHELEMENASLVDSTSKKNTETTETNWTSNEFPWSREAMKELKSTFNDMRLHLTQLKAINATMSNKDALVVLPTGGGKSMCYQLPALLCKGITIVISPLVSLMNDQVLSLQKMGIKSEMLHSKSPLYTKLEVYNEMENSSPRLKLLFVTPERISQSLRFLSQLDKCYRMGNLARIAIDEVHCVEHWGNNFRPDYRNLGSLKLQFPDVPLLGVTATATSSSLEEVKKILNIPNSLEFISFYPRNNLFYEVRPKPSTGKGVISDIVNLIKSNFNEQSGIIYCLSRSDCESVCRGLQQHGIEAVVYHSALSDSARKEAQEKWLAGDKKVICATNAFGMGINKLDVRFVIHHSLSKSMETYYQESGRAGRDGMPALCLLYFGFSDIFRNVGLVVKERDGSRKLNSIIKYAQNVTRCRHKALADIFDEDTTCCNQMCDLCNKGYDYKTCDVTSTCLRLMDIVQSTTAKGERLTGRQLIDTFRKFWKKDCAETLEQLECCVTRLLIDGYFKMSCHIYPAKSIPYIIPGLNARFLRFNQIKMHCRVQTVDRNAIYHKVLHTVT